MRLPASSRSSTEVALHSDGVGELHTFCPECARREFAEREGPDDTPRPPGPVGGRTRGRVLTTTQVHQRRGLQERTRKFSRQGASSWCPMPHGSYDRELMKRGEEARRLISHGEDPVRMLLAVVWPGHDWAESAMRTPLTDCPCSDRTDGCAECGSTGLITVDRRKLLAIEELAATMYAAA
jgi:hypothetical protein